MIIPRLYQVECLDCIDKARALGEIRALAVMATRLGKTITAALDVKRFLTKPKARLLYLCHKTDILYQARTEFELVIGHEKSYGFFHGQEKNFHDVDCLFSSFETMRNYIDVFDPEEFDYVVVDESHHSHAETYLPVIRHFKPKFLLGITATPDRMDQKSITEIYGEPVFELPLEKALALGYLTPLDYRLLTDEIQTDRIIQTPDKLWNISALNRQIFVPKRDEEIARTIALHTSGIKDPKTIIFCSSVKHCDHLVNFIPDSLTIHSGISRKERDVRVEMFRQNMLNTVITVDCFNEGMDIPRANVIVFLRSTSSMTIFLQQLGRGLTKTEGKDKVIILDFVANIERVRIVQQLQRKVIGFMPSKNGYKAAKGPPPVMFEVGKVFFNEKLISLTDLLEKIIRKEFYPTWQEGSQATIALGIESARDYKARYQEDQRLPSNPNTMWTDFPSWDVFLAKPDPIKRYETWLEATSAIVALGIKNQKEYWVRYKEDPKLVVSPHTYYKDFPGYNVYLGLKYRLCSEASQAAIALGIQTRRDYEKNYKKDPKLLIDPHRKFPDFPGWEKFLGKV